MYDKIASKTNHNNTSIIQHKNQIAADHGCHYRGPYE